MTIQYAYYNECEPFAAEWLRNLIKANLIAPGYVDERDIRNVEAYDLQGFWQHHFFAGIGVWSYALRLAGWPDDRAICTGSCPCQPFSVAGFQHGTSDKRHLWPEWFRLIRQFRPSIILGEQVASAAALEWFDLVSNDLENTGYTVGAADLCAASVGAPHIRQRLFWMADGSGSRLARRTKQPTREKCTAVERSGNACRLADADTSRFCSVGSGQLSTNQDTPHWNNTDGRCKLSGFWVGAEWFTCSDGKARSTQPGIFPLAYGASSRMGRLRAYGNAIVAPLAAEFVKAVMQLEVE